MDFSCPGRSEAVKQNYRADLYARSIGRLVSIFVEVSTPELGHEYYKVIRRESVLVYLGARQFQFVLQVLYNPLERFEFPPRGDMAVIPLLSL